ncbi:uncharacterized protein EDB91DRAFT_1347702 [Suillus paluster]|uniref:uncharacterized protein n=1 Tax=Suillus paluster TaxID=48578 RepID=UPI001B87A2A3|nr:uncharacterized protein EDB91DRAFT_1347702 [Suillus paluster]KAG1738095.1 hypothetical protein EDB91DRAFT_1347702 [Suillus paluster]
MQPQPSQTGMMQWQWYFETSKSKFISSMSTPTEKAAAMRAAKLKRHVEAATTPESAPSRPSRQSKATALKNQVWMSEKKTRKWAASSTAEPDHAKQAQTSDKKKPDPANRQKSSVTWPAAQPFESDSDDFKVDGSDGASSDFGAESNNKESDDDSILGLIGDKLKATLDYERPQFTLHNDNSSVASTFSSMPSTSPVSDDEALIGTMDSATEDTGNSLTTNGKKSGSHYRPSKLKGTSTKTNQKVALSKGTKHMKQREQEKPTWCTPNKVDDTTSDGPPADDEAVSARSIRSCKDDWLPSCRIMYSASGKVNITEQQPHIQDMLRASITCLHKHILFENAYLDLQQRRKIMADILLSCAKDGEDSEFVDVRKRLMKDAKYVCALSLVPEGRIGTIRRNVRKAAQAHVASHYGLTKGADDRVKDLLKNNAYIYPVNAKGDPIRTKPFQVPAILDTIEDAFFSDELAAGVKWHDHLTSTIDDHPEEVELPVAMVALASAAVCSVIMQYSSEKYDQDFNSDMYGRIYRTLVGLLNGIFKTSERKFHVLGHSLYMSVYGSKRKTEEPSAAESLMFLDIDGMAEE